MRLGVMLPSFRDDPSLAVAAASEAEALGIHGVFLYDHLWPMGEPGHPAISSYPLLGVIAERTDSIRLGTLVARVGLVPNDVLVRELQTVNALSAGRLIAGLGTGDHLSELENLAYGVGFAPTPVRRSELVNVAEALQAKDVEVWVGGGSKKTNELALLCHATLNLWGASPDKLQQAAALGEVTWGGHLLEDRAERVAQLGELKRSGASWAVSTWPSSLAELAKAASEAGLLLNK